MSIPKSIKTRLLSAAYSAAYATSQRVFNFTERLRVQKEDSYQDDLFDYRDKLADELVEGKELIEVLAAHNNKVQGELDFVEREINGPTYTEREQVPEGAGVRDFDDLPAPQGVNEDEAPEGYKAVIGAGGCTGCHLDPTEDTCQAPACFSEHRGDGQEVIFVKR